MSLPWHSCGPGTTRVIRPASALRRLLPGKRDPERDPHVQNKCRDGERLVLSRGSWHKDSWAGVERRQRPGKGWGQSAKHTSRQLQMESAHPECRGKEGRRCGTTGRQGLGPEASCTYERGGFHPKPRRKGSSTAFTQHVAGRAQPVAQVPSLLFCPHIDHQEPRVPLPGLVRDRGLDTG